MLRKWKWQIPEEPLAAQYNWCQGPLLGRGPAVEKHWSLDNGLTDGGEVVSFTNLLRSTLQSHFVYSWQLEVESTPEAIVRVEGLVKFKEKANDFIGIQTCNLLTCSLVPQPTMLRRALLLHSTVRSCMFSYFRKRTEIWKKHENQLIVLLVPECESKR
jgi:hypothetical protein